MPLNFTGLIPDEEDDQQTQQKPWMRSRVGAQQPDDMGYTMARAENGAQPVPAPQPAPANGNGPITIPQQKPTLPQQPPQPMGPPAPAPEDNPNLTVGQPTQADQNQQLEGLMPQMKTGATSGVVHPPTPIEQMQTAGKESAGLGPRPTNLQDIPNAQRHHGFRKALDIAAAVGLGAYTMNPLAGAGVYKQMSRAPLRKAQDTYDSQLAAAQGKFKTAEELEKQNIGEEKVTNLNEKMKGLEGEREAKANKLNETFVAGSEVQNEGSPTGWVAQTAGGEWKPFTPKAGHGKPSLAETNAEREKEADRLKLDGEDRKYYITNGKLREPGTSIHVPSAEAEMLHDWEEAFKDQNGRKPNADEIAAYKHGSRGGSANQHTFKDAAAIDKYSNDWYAKQRKSVLDEKAKVHSLSPDAAGDDKTLQAEYQKIEAGYNEKAKQFENEKRNWYAQIQGGKPVSVAEPEGGVPAIVGGGGGPAQQIQPVQGGPPAAAPQQGPGGIEQPITSVRQPPGGHKIGDAVEIAGKTMYVQGFDANGRPSLSLEKPGGATAAQPSPAPGAPPTAPQQGPQVGGGYTKGQQITVDGKPAYVTGWNETTKKPRVSRIPPAS